MAGRTTRAYESLRRDLSAGRRALTALRTDPASVAPAPRTPAEGGTAALEARLVPVPPRTSAQR